MAIKLASISKVSPLIYSVTVTDDVTEKSYTVSYNSNETADALKARIQDAIAKEKYALAETVSVESVIKSAVESIDTTKIVAKE